MTTQEWVRSMVACSSVGQDLAGAAATCSSVGQGHDVRWATSAGMGARYAGAGARQWRSLGVDADMGGGRRRHASGGMGVWTLTLLN
jgi:hypothetical protein